ncbi:MAG: imidazoleglycerol-phosphate dehydratase [Candidatus Margulisbacteria bacterium GWF2_35_9]|nr:MAG: imidazoleglycerol-phosphate dehydratase [Candidatus Margulisbacteria bacterium GWF2_35_9]
MRKASDRRKTNETNVSVEWNLDGTGAHQIDTSNAFMNHMLELFSKHGFFDLTVKASGDIAVDDHHTIEDLGIVMGTVFKKAIGDKKGIFRYGFYLLPMDESLALISLDISNRPYLNFDVKYQNPLQNFDSSLIKEFFSAFVINAGITLHIKLLAGDNTHHIIESIFKGFAKALNQAVQLDKREKNIPSTKGII